jgi:hypothetical protein
VTACERCDGRGKVWAHDRYGDGHGGLNGGEWGYFQCSACDGTGDANAKEKRRANWPESWEIRVCYTCGTPKSNLGYTACDKPYCGTQGHGETVKVVRA